MMCVKVMPLQSNSSSQVGKSVKFIFQMHVCLIAARVESVSRAKPGVCADKQT